MDLDKKLISENYWHICSINCFEYNCSENCYNRVVIIILLNLICLCVYPSFSSNENARKIIILFILF